MPASICAILPSLLGRSRAAALLVAHGAPHPVVRAIRVVTALQQINTHAMRSAVAKA